MVIVSHCTLCFDSILLTLLSQHGVSQPFLFLFQVNSDAEDQKEVADSDETKDKSNNLFGVTTTTNVISITDYFAQKMAALKESRLKNNGTNNASVGPVGQTEEIQTPTEDVAHVDCADEQLNRKISKKSKRCKNEEDGSTETVSQDNIEEEAQLKDRKKKSKKRKSCKDEENVSTETVSQDNTEVETRKSKKRKSCKDEENITMETVTQDSIVVETKKSKKSKKSKDDENISSEVNSQNSTEIHVPLEVSKASKKGKNDNSLPDEDITNDANSGKKRKKKSTRKSETKEIEDDVKEGQTAGVESCIDQQTKIKKAKKSKNERCEVTDNCADVESTSRDVSELTDTSGSQSSKKSKKKGKPSNKGSSECKPNPATESASEKTQNMSDDTEGSTKTVSSGADQDSATTKAENQPSMKSLRNATKRKKTSKTQNEKKRMIAAEAEKTDKGLGFVGTNLEEIGGYGGGFVVKYPWFDKK